MGVVGIGSVTGVGLISQGFLIGQNDLLSPPFARSYEKIRFWSIFTAIRTQYVGMDFIWHSYNIPIFVLMGVNTSLQLWLITRGRFLLGLSRARVRRMSGLITELFPILGIMGTVWGLAQALQTFGTASEQWEELQVVTRHFGVALSTTFFGLAGVGLSLLVSMLHADEEDAG